MEECSKIPRFRNFDIEFDETGSADSWTPAEPESSGWIATMSHKLDDVLKTLPLREILDHGTLHSRTLSPSSSLADLMMALCTEKRVAIMENGNFCGMITRDNLIEFLSKNSSQLGESLKARLSYPKFHMQNTTDKGKTKEVFQMFLILWEKQLDGTLASSKTSSPLDLFLNWLGYAQKVAEDGDPEEDEPEMIEEDENLKTVLEFFSRRKNVRVLYVQANRKVIRGWITRKDLIRFLLFQ